jgi:transcriptional regulator with XRE-family HTH domain
MSKTKSRVAALGITQAVLADLAGVTEAYLSRYANGLSIPKASAEQIEQTITRLEDAAQATGLTHFRGMYRHEVANFISR